MKLAGVVLFVAFQAREGHVAQLQDRLLSLADQSLREEPGCLAYEVHADLDDPNRVWLYESWASPEALAAHDQTPYVVKFLADLPSLSEAGFERWRAARLGWATTGGG